MAVYRGGNIVGGDESESGLDWLTARTGDGGGANFAVGRRGEGFAETFAPVGEWAEIELPIRILGSQRRRGHSTGFGGRQRVLKFIEGDKHAHREKIQARPRRRAVTAWANCSSTGRVSCQERQASVMLCP